MIGRERQNIFYIEWERLYGISHVIQHVYVRDLSYMYLWIVTYYYSRYMLLSHSPAIMTKYYSLDPLNIYSEF